VFQPVITPHLTQCVRGWNDSSAERSHIRGRWLVRMIGFFYWCKWFWYFFCYEIGRSGCIWVAAMPPAGTPLVPELNVIGLARMKVHSEEEKYTHTLREGPCLIFSKQFPVIGKINELSLRSKSPESLRMVDLWAIVKWKTKLGLSGPSWLPLVLGYSPSFQVNAGSSRMKVFEPSQIVS